MAAPSEVSSNVPLLMVKKVERVPIFLNLFALSGAIMIFLVSEVMGLALFVEETLHSMVCLFFGILVLKETVFLGVVLSSKTFVPEVMTTW